VTDLESSSVVVSFSMFLSMVFFPVFLRLFGFSVSFFLLFLFFYLVFPATVFVSCFCFGFVHFNFCQSCFAAFFFSYQPCFFCFLFFFLSVVAAFCVFVSSCSRIGGCWSLPSVVLGVVSGSRSFVPCWWWRFVVMWW
jgi:hypothetical protein